MLTAATYDYIESDFSDPAETLGQYRARTCRQARPALVRRVCRKLIPAR